MRYIVQLVIFYIGITAFMFFRQGQLIFPSHYAPMSLNPDYTKFEANDGTQLETKIYKAKSKNAPLVVLFTGNAQNAVITGEVIWNAFQQDVNLAAMNYRSYGYSEGKASEEAIFSDALEFVKFTMEKHKSSKVYLMGISLGTGVVSYIASKEEVDGLILMAPFDSIANVAQSSYPWLPVKWLIQHRFDSIKHLKEVTVPIAIIRAGRDQVIPAKRTEALAKSINNLVYDQTLNDMRHTQVLHPSQNKLLVSTIKQVSQALKM